MIGKKISNYFSLVTFSHTIFAMPFALIGFFLAIHFSSEKISWHLLILIILCMAFARNAAMAFNRITDKTFDSLNPRTALREIPTGIIKPGSAIIFIIINSILFIITTLFINKITFLLSPVALIIILGYSLMKRITVLCHFVLGLGLSLAPIGAYLSVTGRFHWLPLLYSAIVLLWVSGFDIIYSLQDDVFDKTHSLKSIPAALGRRRAIIISSALHTLCAFLVILSGLVAGMGLLNWIGAIIFISLLIYQHFIIKPDDLSRVNLAFATLNGIASLIFASFVVADLLIK